MRFGSATRRARRPGNGRPIRRCRGDVLSFDQKPPAKAPPRKPKGANASERDMGDALRSVYDKAVQESVPDEMLDLLDKLR